jgi:hypothetical protein
VAPGEGDPSEYVEIEVNPLGAIFDARVTNPHGRRDSMRVDATWNAVGLVAAVSRRSQGTWTAQLEIPWSDLCLKLRSRWRSTFQDRAPRDGEHELSCYRRRSSTSDFHKPAVSRRLVLDGLDDRA